MLSKTASCAIYIEKLGGVGQYLTQAPNSVLGQEGAKIEPGLEACGFTDVCFLDALPSAIW